MSDLTDAVKQMDEAAAGLRPYIQHTCLWNRSDSPDGDVCTCGRNKAIKAANEALYRLQALVQEQEQQYAAYLEAVNRIAEEHYGTGLGFPFVPSTASKREYARKMFSPAEPEKKS